MSDQVGDMGGQYLAEGIESVVPEGYKLTEVGLIPCDWKLSYVGELFSMQLGKMLDEDKNTGSTKSMLGNRGVQWGRIDTSSLGYVRLAQSELRRYRLAVGDILVCEGGEVGRSAIWKGEVEECYFQKALHRLRPKADYEGSLLVNYLHWLARKGGLKNFVTQTSIAHLPKEKLEIVPIPVPVNKQEQTAIATALSDVDALISEQEKLIAKKQAIKTATMQQLLTGRTRLPQFALREDGSAKGYKQSELGEVPEDWDLRQLCKLTTLMTNGFVGTAKLHYTESYDGVTYIQGYNVEENGFNYRGIKKVTREFHKRNSKSSLRKDDVLMVQTGNVGLVTIVPKELEGANCHALIICRFKKEFEAKFFAYYLNSVQCRQRLKELETGTTMKHINVGDLLYFEIPYPSNKVEQNAIANVLADMDQKIEALQGRLAKTCQIKQGMMQELLTGKTRLLKPEQLQ